MFGTWGKKGKEEENNDFSFYLVLFQVLGGMNRFQRKRYGKKSCTQFNDGKNLKRNFNIGNIFCKHILRAQILLLLLLFYLETK